MSTDKNGRYCDECGRSIKKAHRIHKGFDYCGRCYPVVFRKQICVSCGNVARAHKNEDPNTIICKKCLLANRKCIRCEKPTPKAGLITQNGAAVCPSCTPYFKPKAPCNICGTLSSRLSRVPQYGVDEKVCPSCRNKFTHQTCSHCGKYRKVYAFKENNESYCKPCFLSGSNDAHACPDCGTQLPGAGNSRCRPCLNKRRLNREVSLHQYTFTHEWSRALFQGFSHWLYLKKPENPTLITQIQFHEAFFERLDACFVRIEDISSTQLLDHFTIAELRKYLLSRQYIQQQLSIEFSTELKAAKGELDSIKNKIAEHSHQSWGELIRQYATWLEKTDTQPRTARLYIRAAEKFCKNVEGVSLKRPFTNSELVDFIQANHSAKASLYRFITFCKDILGWPVSMPTKKTTLNKVNRHSTTALQVRNLIRQVDELGIENTPIDTVYKIIAKVFGFKIHEISSLDWEVRETKIGLNLLIQSETIEVPTYLHPILKRANGYRTTVKNAE